MKFSAIISIISLTLTSAPVFSDRYENLFPPEWVVEQTPLELKGVSKLTVGYVFDVYVAAFYQPEDRGPVDALSDLPRHLEIHYLRNISKSDFIDAAEDMLSKQHSPEEIATIRDEITQINQSYQDVKKGDRYSLTYLPGYGTELKFNGATKAVIPGSDFAQIYFSIWLGEKSPYLKFRNKLIGLP